MSKSKAEAITKNPDDSGNTKDPSSPEDVPLDDDMVTTVSMQAAIIAIIIICAWAQCFARAIRLRFALQIHERVNTAEPDADLGPEIEAIVINPVQGGARTSQGATTACRDPAAVLPNV